MFTKIKNWMSHTSAQGNDYGCVMVYGRCPEFNMIQAGLDPQDVHTFENEIHITILYGINPDVSSEDVVHQIEKLAFGGKSLWTNRLTAFQTPGQDDVLNLSIQKTPELTDFRNNLMLNLENEQTYPTYNPHITIAYIKEGAASKYTRILDCPVKFVPTSIIYSPPSKDGESKEISIPIY